MKTNRKLSIILILLQLIPIIDTVIPYSCACKYMHPQVRYCTTQTVLSGNYIRTISNDKIVFEVVLLFKANIPHYPRLGKITVVTPPGCGFPYKTTKDRILLFGNLTGKTLNTKVCDGQLWPLMTEFKKRGIAFNYARGCRCLHKDIGKQISEKPNICLGMHTFINYRYGKCEMEQHKKYDLCEARRIFHNMIFFLEIPK